MRVVHRRSARQAAALYESHPEGASYQIRTQVARVLVSMYRLEQKELNPQQDVVSEGQLSTHISEGSSRGGSKRILKQLPSLESREGQVAVEKSLARIREFSGGRR